MALAGHDHVVITIKAAFGRPAGDVGCECSKCCPLRGLAFLAAKGAAHAAALAGDERVRHAQHLGDDVLHLGWMLGRGNDGHRRAFLWQRHGDLAFEVEMFLPADKEALLDLVRR